MIVQNTSVLRKDLTILWSLDLHLLQLQSGHLCWRSPLIQILFCFRYLHRSEIIEIVLRASKSLRPFKSSSCAFVFMQEAQSVLSCVCVCKPVRPFVFCLFCLPLLGPLCQQVLMTRMIMMTMMVIRQ